MGLRGNKNRQLRRWCIPGSREFNELLFGVEGAETEAEYAAAFPRIRRPWRAGGKQAVMSSKEFVGWRPLGFWLCDVTAAHRRLAEKTCRVEAEAILRLNLASKAERQAIIAGGIIAEQLREIAQDKARHPEDYA